MWYVVSFSFYCCWCIVHFIKFCRHEELLDSNGIYAEMWNQQSKQQNKTETSDEEGTQKDSKPVKGKGIGKNGNSNMV